MRVTNRSMTRNYLKNMNRSISDYSASSNKLQSGRAFSKVSENTSDAARAFKIREQIYKNEQYEVNIRDADGEASSAEGNMSNINSILKNVNEKVIQAMNGNYGPDERAIIAQELDNYADQIMQIANSKYGNRYLFAGSNNDVKPFEYKNGALYFNGQDVATNNRLDFPKNKDTYIDVGLGIAFADDGTMDDKTAVKVSISGVDLLGFGTTPMPGGNGEFNNNIVVAIKDLATKFKDGDMSDIQSRLNHFQDQMDSFQVNLTNVGDRSKFLEDTANRIADDIIDLKESQKNLEAVSTESEVINNKGFESAWMITLQLGSKIIPPSIFDFMR